MDGARFPTKKADGSLAVSARFTIKESNAEQIVNGLLEKWVASKQENQIDLLQDLKKLPYLAPRSGETLDVVFEGRGAPSLWKDWMVELTHYLIPLCPSVEFQCFYDLVSESAHPASKNWQ